MFGTKVTKGGRWCAAKNCSNNSKLFPNMSFFYFPLQSDRCNIWIVNCGRMDLMERTSDYCHRNCRLCSEHFEDEMFLNDLKNRLKPDAIPTIFRCKSDMDTHQAVSHDHTYSIISKARDIDAILLTSKADSLKLDTDTRPSPSHGHAYSTVSKARYIDAIPSTSKADSLKFTTAKDAELHQSTPTSYDDCVLMEEPHIFVESPTDESSVISSQIAGTVISKACQTTSSLTYGSPRKAELRRKLRQSQYKLSKLQNKLSSPLTSLSKGEEMKVFFSMCDNLLPSNLSNFVKLQVQLISKSAKGKRYPTEYKQFALMIYFLSPKAYKFVAKTYCLPNPRTLRRITETWDIQPGLLNEFMLNVIKLRINGMSEKARQCVLCVDEMTLKRNLYYISGRDEIIGLQHVTENREFRLANSVLILMIRGLHFKWKQPVSYVFTENSCSGEKLKNVLFKTIEKLGEINIDVKCVVSDLGSNFYAFTKKMNISPEKTYFEVNGKKILYFFDTPHLIKAVCNNLFDYNFSLNGQLIEKRYIEDFYNKEKNQEHKFAYKLTDLHLQAKKFQRMKVKLATQLLSNTVATGMSIQMCYGILPATAKPTIDFIENMDKLFDLMNSSRKAEAKKYNRAYIGAEYQINFLKKMMDVFKNMRVLKKESSVDITKSIRCLRGWQITITSLIQLYEDLGTDVIYTRRINQDPLENFIGSVRNQGGHCVEPTPIQFKRAFKKLFCTSYFQYSDGMNCAEDFDEVLAQFGAYYDQRTLLSFPGNIRVQPLFIDTTDYRELSLPETNSLVYVCGYLLKKCLQKHNCEICNSYAHTEHDLTETSMYTHFKAYRSSNDPVFGKLLVPPKDFVNYIFSLDNIFVKQFRQCALKHPAIQLKAHLVSVPFQHPCKEFPSDYLVSLYIRMKIFHTLKTMNKDIIISRKARHSRKEVALIKHF